jgi:hypothetical protein
MGVTIDIKGNKDLGKKTVRQVSYATNSAMAETARNIQTKGRSDIASHYKRMGRMANAWKAVKSPKKNTGDILDPLVHAYHKASYSEIFEAGQTTEITPQMRRWLWIPFPGSPAARLYKMQGNSAAARQGPAAIADRFGMKLVLIVRPGRPPILAGVYNVKKSGAFSKTKNQQGQLTPMFFARPKVDITGQWKVEQIAENEANDLENKIAARLGD